MQTTTANAPPLCPACGHAHERQPTLFDPEPICGYRDWWQTREEPPCECRCQDSPKY